MPKARRRGRTLVSPERHDSGLGFVQHSPGPVEEEAALLHCSWRDCSDEFPSQLERSLHVAEHLDCEVENTCRWRGCPTEGVARRSFANLASHITQHTGCLAYMCPYARCNCGFESAALRDTHVEQHFESDAIRRQKRTSRDEAGAALPGAAAATAAPSLRDGLSRATIAALTGMLESADAQPSIDPDSPHCVVLSGRIVASRVAAAGQKETLVEWTPALCVLGFAACVSRADRRTARAESILTGAQPAEVLFGQCRLPQPLGAGGGSF
eukprot:m.75781 g.75781  ORF g.75781 m.75781 type:complete len:269 (+) comp8095_c0_seq1:1303-2109(+)